MIEWIYYLRHAHSPQRGPEDTPCIMTVRNKIVRGVLESLKSSVAVLVHRLEIIMRIAAIESRNLDIMEIIGSQGGRDQVMALKEKVGTVTIMDSRFKIVFRIV